MLDTSPHDAVEGKVFASQKMKLATLNALAAEQQATLEVQSTSQDEGGNWKWIRGLFGDCWRPEDRKKLKTRARLVSEWIEVEDAHDWAAIAKSHRPYGNEGYCVCGVYECEAMKTARLARSV